MKCAFSAVAPTAFSLLESYSHSITLERLEFHFQSNTTLFSISTSRAQHND